MIRDIPVRPIITPQVVPTQTAYEAEAGRLWGSAVPPRLTPTPEQWQETLLPVERRPWDLRSAEITHHDEEDYVLQQDEKTLEALALSHKCSVYIPTDSQITVDLDTPEDIQKVVGRAIGLQSAGFVLAPVEQWASKSGNQHRVYQLSGAHMFSMPEKLMIAVALGSDPKRESINLKRWMMGQREGLRVLFKPLDTPKTVAAKPAMIKTTNTLEI